MIVKRCYEFYYRITCYICDTLKIRYGPSAWTRMGKCYVREKAPIYIVEQIRFLEDTLRRSEERKKKVTPSVRAVIQTEIDAIKDVLRSIKKPYVEWPQSLTLWGDMIRGGIDEFLDLAAKKKCASYGGPGTICAKWEMRDLRFWEEVIE